MVSDPPFLFIKRCPRIGIGFADTCSLGISPGRFDMFLPRQDANTTEGLQKCVGRVMKP